MSWLGRVFGGKKPVEKVEDGTVFPADLWCTFCGKHRREVRKLIAGPKVYICDECIALCVEIMQSEARQGGDDYTFELVMADIDRRGPRARHADVRPLLRAAIALADNAPARLRRVAWAASQVCDLPTELAAWTAMPADLREPADRLAIAATLFHSGRHPEALATLDEVAVDALAPASALMARLWRSLIELRLGPTRPQLAVHLAGARGMVVDLAKLADDPAATTVRATRLAVITFAAIGLGDLAIAEAAARDRLVLVPDDAWAHEGLARVLRAKGDADGAARELTTARDLHHPDETSVLKLSSSGDGPFR